MDFELTELVTRNISLTSCGAPVRNHGGDYVVLSNVMIIVSAVFVVIRFAFKATVSRMDFGYDDWCVLITLISAIPSAIAAFLVHGSRLLMLDRSLRGAGR